MSKHAGTAAQQSPTGQVSLFLLFWTFLKIGGTAFGGFMALISVVEQMIVERRKLLRHEDMLDGISLASILPGPVAVNVVAFVGYRLRGASGACVSAVAVILPSFVLIVSLTIAYLTWGQLPVVDKLFMGFIPAVTAIIVSTAWAMSRKAVTGIREGLIMLAAAGLLLGVGGFFITVIIILSAGVIGWALFRKADTNPQTKPPPPPEADGPSDKGGSKPSVLVAAPLFMSQFFAFELGMLGKLFVTFAGMSVMLFGGGYVFVPLIQEIVVAGQGWVTQQEFVDAIAMGQITPGPILISAAFIGYKVAGLAGAVVATVGIFSPPILLMLSGTHAMERIKHSPVIRAALGGVRPAVVGMIFAAAVVVGRTASVEGGALWVSMLICAAALVALLRLRVQVIWIIPAAGIAGLLLY